MSLHFQLLCGPGWCFPSTNNWIEAFPEDHISSAAGTSLLLPMPHWSSLASFQSFFYHLRGCIPARLPSLPLTLPYVSFPHKLQHPPAGQVWFLIHAYFSKLENKNSISLERAWFPRAKLSTVSPSRNSSQSGIPWVDLEKQCDRCRERQTKSLMWKAVWGLLWILLNIHHRVIGYLCKCNTQPLRW